MRKKTLMNLKKKHQEGPAATPAPPGLYNVFSWLIFKHSTMRAFIIFHYKRKTVACFNHA
jgi:hypothetical protein